MDFNHNKDYERLHAFLSSVPYIRAKKKRNKQQQKYELTKAGQEIRDRCQKLECSFVGSYIPLSSGCFVRCNCRISCPTLFASIGNWSELTYLLPSLILGREKI